MLPRKDAVIIGLGWTGAILAQQLTEAGLNVVAIERGPYRDTSTDFNFYTKRAILAGVYGATLVRWFNDADKDAAATDAFLDARIENVMQFEKLKAGAKKAFANFGAAKKPA